MKINNYKLVAEVNEYDCVDDFEVDGDESEEYIVIDGGLYKLK